VDPVPGAPEVELDPTGMQAEAHPRLPFTRVAVNQISNQREPGVGQVDPDLMHHSGLDAHFNPKGLHPRQGDLPDRVDPGEGGNRFTPKASELALWKNDHPLLALGVVGEREVDFEWKVRAECMGFGLRPSQVRFVKGTLGELLPHFHEELFVFGEQKHATGSRIQAMEQLNGEAREKCLDAALYSVLIRILLVL
jgi:hypothetical protein